MYLNDIKLYMNGIKLGVVLCVVVCCVMLCVVLCVVLCWCVVSCVLCVVSCASVRRRRRPSSSSSVRPSVTVVRRRPSLSVRPSRPSVPSVPSRPSSSVVVDHLQIQGRMQIFEKLIKIEAPRPRDYQIRNLRGKCCRFLGSKLKKVAGKYVLWMIYFSIRILAPMLIIAVRNLWIYQKYDINETPKLQNVYQKGGTGT